MDRRFNGKTVCIAGLGYVGLPLALAFSGHLKAIGFDVDAGATAAPSVMSNG
jgi:UDP-N-acetyl-D-mannosaminuronate dehydrogenase